MARQNQKNIKKSQEDKVVKSTKSGVSKLKKSPPKKNKVVQEKVTDEHTITELGQKVKVLNDISTVDGTLHKDEVVVVESLVAVGTNNIKVIDNVGRFWYINSQDISTKLWMKNKKRS